MSDSLPLLSEIDPVASAEGTLDPMGVYSIADALAVQLIPGVRERQSRARFITAIAVSMAVCRDFDADAVAVDQVSEPWQIFEWYAVEGFVRTRTDQTDLGRLPGQDKVGNAIRDGVPVSASRYLKTPRVFGFHGVYRQLVRSIGVDESGFLGAIGDELLQTWSHERGLHGFWGSKGGTGQSARNMLRDAVSDGLKQAAVDRSAQWAGWEFFGEHLALDQIGSGESGVMRRAFMAVGQGYRPEVMQALISKAGRVVWKKANAERDFHSWLAEHSGENLRELLQTIRAFERWSRLLQDAFDQCLWEMTRRATKTTLNTLSHLPCVERAHAACGDLFIELLGRLEPFGRSGQFRDSFAALGEQIGVIEWTNQLLDHHRRIQRNKPPNGKNPWFDRFDDGAVAVRPAYRRMEPVLGDDGYVNGYRTTPLWSFASDLGLIA